MAKSPNWTMEYKPQAVLTVEETKNEAPSRLTDFYFNIVSAHSLSLQNDITDNFIENNTAVHDHIAHQPLTISLSGISGEKVYTNEQAEIDYQKQLQTTKFFTTGYNIINKLGSISALIPSVGNATQNAINKVQNIVTSAKRYIGIVDGLANWNNPVDTYFGANQTLKETRLQEIFRKLSLISSANTSMWVHTPYGDFLNMYIQSITLKQDDVNFISDIEITLKQLQFAEVKHDKVDTSVMSQYNAYAQAKASDNGKLSTDNRSMAAKDWDAGHFGASIGM